MNWRMSLACHRGQRVGGCIGSSAMGTSSAPSAAGTESLPQESPQSRHFRREDGVVAEQPSQLAVAAIHMAQRVLEARARRASEDGERGRRLGVVKAPLQPGVDTPPTIPDGADLERVMAQLQDPRNRRGVVLGLSTLVRNPERERTRRPRG